jgi:hypothetical protein
MLILYVSINLTPGGSCHCVSISVLRGILREEIILMYTILLSVTMAGKLLGIRKAVESLILFLFVKRLVNFHHFCTYSILPEHFQVDTKERDAMFHCVIGRLNIWHAMSYKARGLINSLCSIIRYYRTTSEHFTFLITLPCYDIQLRFE